MQIKETFLNLTKTYKNAIDRLEKLFDPEFEKTVKLINSSDGHIVVCGMGKSGLVGRKISATLASTGTPSYFLHPGEAIHGDLGIVQSKSIIILISYSGETDEILALLPALKRLKVKIIVMTGELNSNLAKNSDIVLNISVDKEACPLNLAPTTSTLTTLIIGDALAVSLMNLKNFKQEDFALTHPGGSLGRRLLLSVKDEMITQNLPFVNKNGTMKEVVLKMTESRLGLALIGNEEKLEGIITDGDLRRSLLMSDDFTKIEIKDILNKSPMTVYENDNLQVAHERMKEARLQSLVVKNNDQVIKLNSDDYVIAINPFNLNDILKESNMLEMSLPYDKLNLVNNQISFRIGFNKKIDFKNTTNNKNYIDQNLFKESKFKKLSIQHIKEIINARVVEILDHLFNKNKNLKYANKKVLRIDIFFEDKEILDFLGSTFYENLKVDNLETEIKLIHSDDFFALSGAAELIYKGWDKEAIPLNVRKKSIISRFFERFF